MPNEREYANDVFFKIEEIKESKRRNDGRNYTAVKAQIFQDGEWRVHKLWICGDSIAHNHIGGTYVAKSLQTYHGMHPTAGQYTSFTAYDIKDEQGNIICPSGEPQKQQRAAPPAQGAPPPPPQQQQKLGGTAEKPVYSAKVLMGGIVRLYTFALKESTELLAVKMGSLLESNPDVFQKIVDRTTGRIYTTACKDTSLLQTAIKAEAAAQRKEEEKEIGEAFPKDAPPAPAVNETPPAETPSPPAETPPTPASVDWDPGNPPF